MDLGADAFRSGVGQRFAGKLSHDDVGCAFAVDAVVNLLLVFSGDQQCGCAIAPSQAGDFANAAVVWTLIAQSSLQFLFEQSGAAEVARHIGAHANIHACGSGEMKVRIKTRNGENLTNVHSPRVGDGLQFIRRQIPVLALNCLEVFKYAVGVVSRWALRSQ